MNELKRLMEEQGSIRKQLNSLTNERASKLNEMRTLGKKSELTEEEQTKYETLKNEISEIDNKITMQQEQLDMVNEQINQERLNGDSAGRAHDFQYQDAGAGDPEGEEMKQFSLIKAFQDCLQHGQPQGFEAEMAQEGQKEMKAAGQSPKGNIIIPSKLMGIKSIRNDLTATGGSGGDQGGVTVEKSVDSLIDILRKKLPFVDSNDATRDGLGATFFTDLQGDVAFPRASEDASDPAVKAETAAADEMSPTFDEITLSPKRLPTFAEVSRQLLLQNSVSVESWLNNYLMYKVSKSMHSNVITYLLGLSGTNAVENGTDGGALDWAKVVEFETAVASADAEEEERLAFLFSPKVRGKLKVTEKATNTAQFIYQNGEVNNYQALVSTLMPDDLDKGATTGTLSAAIFANWASLYLGMWGGIEMLVNPYIKDTEGLIRINAWTFFDRVARRAESFSISKDIVTA